MHRRKSMKVDISIVPGGIPPTIKVSQYDVGRIIDVKIDMGDVSTSSSLTYLMEVRKSDNHVTSANGTVVTGGYVRFVTTQQMTAVPGIALCKVRVKYGNNDLGTAKFYMNIEETPFNGDADLSDSEVSPLLAALAASSQEAVEAKEAAQAATAAAQNAAAQAQATAETIQDYIDQIQRNTDAIAVALVVTDEVTRRRYKLTVRNGEVFMREVSDDEDDS